MTPIPFDLPRRILPPTTAYAAGLVCELRPDLADGVRSAVLGDAAVTALDVLTLARVEAGDEQGANALSYLREIVHYGGNDPKALHRLADVLGLIIWRTLGMAIFTQDGEERMITTMLGDVWTVGNGYTVCGLGGAWASPGQAEDGAALLLRWLREGPDLRLPKPILPGEHEALRRLIPLHAHTVSLDADARAAWAKAHLDALAEPVRPMSPDTLASLLAANPYPGCVVTRPGGAVRLDFDGLTLLYKADGWHFGDLLLATPSTVPDVHAEIRRILKVVMSLKVERALNEAEADGTTDPVAYLTNLAAEKMLAILDVTALANAHKAEIGRLSADVALLKTAPPIKTGEGGLAEIGCALADAGAPQAYHLDDDAERPIPDPERIRLLGERIHTLRAQVREAADATNYLDALIEAHNALDALNAPRLADGCVLSLAARIRALPR